MTVYSVGDCPVGCGGDDLFVLRALPTQEMFLFCPWCEVAYHREAASLGRIRTSTDFAPDGIHFPTRAEVIAAFGADLLVEHAFRVDDFWYDVARTYLACNRVDEALEVVNRVIRTWHKAPGEAFALRDRILASSNPSTPDCGGSLEST
mgnify:CR=1 FL=1